MAVDRVEKRLRKVAGALDSAGVPYAVVGGNAVAAWVGRVDASATRATKDVDVLVRRADTERVTAALASIDFQREDLRDLVLFLNPDEPSRKSGVRLVWARELVRPSHVEPSPDVTDSERGPEGFTVLSLSALVRMKLTSYRDIDRVHVADMASCGLITDGVRRTLPPVLASRLLDIEHGMSDRE